MAGSTFDARFGSMSAGSGQVIRFPAAGRSAARPVLAASVAVFRNGKVLLATRTKPPADQLWSLPGGKVEAGETLEQAALRELEEEVGVSARILGFNRHVEIFGRDAAGAVTHHFVVASFVGEWFAGEPRPGPEAGEVMWADPLKLGGLATTRELGDVLRRAHRLFTTGGTA
ncbi:ADP-ribose pyrophosphatase YjhB, NUDIX family [Hyphomicrobiales bacterium]|nr:ADP-ribose pyrophosphatase YjhB, NUDIX family [Hyphomicrobiales bacterium]CAH1699525.1 ADP-ribose pyrophosphatase YjhB, NUDIX family [Hyphomicrobiales bacterium]CAI0343313.1 8-oxo-dGTP diphosphatase [Hyphomicrobiales bacterium]